MELYSHKLCDMLVPLLYLVVCVFILKFLARKMYPFFQNYWAKAIHAHLAKLKENLFGEAFKQINTGSKKLEILEIGIGTGENFKNYPKNANLTILDKTDEFIPFLQKSLNQSSRNDLKISKLIINQAESMRSISSQSMDAVVHTFVLCSVKNSNMVLDEIDRVLKPGGVCVFIESSLSKKICKKLLQKTVQYLSDECSFNDIKKIFEKNSIYDKLTLKYYEVCSWFPLIMILSPIIYGYGKKSN